MRHLFAALAFSLLGPGLASAQEAAPAAEEAPAAAPAPALPALAPAPAPKESAPAPVPAAAPAETRPAPVPAAAQAGPAATPPAEERHAEPAVRKADEQLAASARTFYLALSGRKAEHLASMSRAPFFFEGKACSTAEELKERWTSYLQGKSLPEGKLYSVDLLSFEEMQAKYGKTPEKLSSWPLRSGVFSVGNLDGHAVVVLWRRGAQGWHAAGVHD